MPIQLNTTAAAPATMAEIPSTNPVMAKAFFIGSILSPGRPGISVFENSYIYIYNRCSITHTETKSIYSSAEKQKRTRKSFGKAEKTVEKYKAIRYTI